jgi:hypothetical protein
VQQILHVPKRQRETDIHHHGETDDLWARLEVGKRAAFCHPATLITRTARLNRFCSDSTIRTAHTCKHVRVGILRRSCIDLVALRIAAKAAALTVSRHGATAAFPTQTELKSLFAHD